MLQCDVDKDFTQGTSPDTPHTYTHVPATSTTQSHARTYLPQAALLLTAHTPATSPARVLHKRAPCELILPLSSANFLLKIP